MGFYQDQIVPLLINWSIRQKNLAAYRARIIPAAEGRVLEIGIGSGLNLPFYSRNVAQVIGLEPSPRLLSMARHVEHASYGAVEFIEGSAESIPLQDASVDTVLTTWTLCSIPDAPRALRDMRRVLRPGGRLSWTAAATSTARSESSLRALAFNSIGSKPATCAARNR